MSQVNINVQKHGISEQWNVWNDSVEESSEKSSVWSEKNKKNS